MSNNPFHQDGLEIEMESLKEETMDNANRSGFSNRPLPPPPSNKSKYMALAIGVVVIGLIFRHSQKEVKFEESLDGVGDTEDLPDAVDFEMENDKSEAASTAPPVPAPVIHETRAPIVEPLIVEEKKGYKHPPEYFSDSYIRRAQPHRKDEFIPDWGQWNFVDPNSEERPPSSVMKQLYADYHNRDVPMASFPAGSWQTDPAYLEPFLKESIALSERAMLAILAEWGHYDPQSGTPFEEATSAATKDSPAFMFNLTVLYEGVTYPKKQIVGNGGFVTPSVYTRLRRYLLHAILTEDRFFLTTGGHSSTAGHGNHFQQSYTLQIQMALEPIFARLGVYHISRNIGMGGLGTVHSALGSQSIYGGDNDLLIWDSGMYVEIGIVHILNLRHRTESDMVPRDLFSRTGLLGGQKVPILLGNPDGGLYEKSFGQGKLGFGMWGTGTAGIPITESLTQVTSLPYAARYVECSKDMYRHCRSLGYNGVCWLNRTDVEPPQKQLGVMGGRAKWHPGNGIHQLKSRFVVYYVLSALRRTLIEWQGMENYTVPDEEWHVSKHYDFVRESTRNLTETSCTQNVLPNITCHTPMYAATEFTPRANPTITSIRYLLHDTVEVDDPPPNCYDPPDIFNSAFHPPDGEIDYVAIVESGNEFQPLQSRREYLSSQVKPPAFETTMTNSTLQGGKGWSLKTNAAADNCDGSYDSFCNRPSTSNCLLYGHNDGRGQLVGDGLSGWLLMTLKNVREGFIMVLVSPHAAYSNTKTNGWKCENNADTCASPISDEESVRTGAVKGEAACTDYKFEFSIDGTIESWSNSTYLEKRKTAERLINLSVLRNQPFSPEGGSKDVELGIRIGGDCGRRATFSFSHVYWA